MRRLCVRAIGVNKDVLRICVAATQKARLCSAQLGECAVAAAAILDVCKAVMSNTGTLVRGGPTPQRN